MTIVIIAVALIVAFVIAYNLNKKPVENTEAVQAPEKIEPPVVEKVKVKEPKKKLVKKASAKKEVVTKKPVKKTK